MTGRDIRSKSIARSPRRAPARTVTILSLVFLVTSTSAVVSQSEPADSSVSYWGTIPERSDSVLRTFADRGMPLWESVLVWPYRVIGFPFTAVRAGVGVSVVAIERSRLPRTIASILGPRQGPFGLLLTFRGGGLSGFGGGLTVEHDALPAAPSRARLGFQSTVKGDHKAHLGLQLAPGGTSHPTEVGAGLRIRLNARYFGIGSQTAESDESRYRHATSWFGASHRRAVFQGSAFLEFDAVVTSVGASSPRDDDEPELADVFAGALPAGYDESSDGISVGITLAHSDVPETARPNRGGLRRARATVFTSTGGPRFKSITYRGELQQFLPLWFPDHVLAFRGFFSWIDPIGSDPVPFQRLMTNNDPDLLRGHRDYRWRDRGMVAISMEYRWPFWAAARAHAPGVDMYLLGDVGQVFGRLSDITPADLSVSVGGGFRLVGPNGFMGRIEIARSEEEWVFRLRGDQIFQFARHGLFYGRDPIPRR